MLETTISIIQTVGTLLGQIIDSGLSILLFAIFMALVYTFGKWIIALIKRIIQK